MQMLITLARKPDLLEQAINEGLKTDLSERLIAGSLRRAAQSRKPPAK
jgi:hypothetical protein